MFYIKLDENMDLVPTVREPLFRGDHLNRKIVYLIPTMVGDIDMLTAYVYLNYIRADGVADVAVLERMEEKYNESYYQYTFPVSCKLTRYPGQVCTWMQIYTGSPSNPSVQKTGECMLQIQESKNMDNYLDDRYLTAIYQIHKSVDQELSDMAEDVARKADGIAYNEETRQLQLKSGEEMTGEPVTVPGDNYTEDIAEAVEDTWSDMDAPDDGSANTESWESM